MGLFGFGKKENKSQAKTAVDQVCKMTLNPEKAAATSTYEGKTYYFCAVGCKKEFDKNPAKYLSGAQSGHHM